MRGYDEGQEQPESDTGEIKANRVSCSILRVQGRKTSKRQRTQEDHCVRSTLAQLQLWANITAGLVR